MVAVGQIHLLFHSTDIRQAGPELPAHPDNQAPFTRQGPDQASHCGLRKPKAADCRALYRPRQPRREFDVEASLNDPHEGKFKLTRRLGEEGRLPLACLHQGHRPLRMERRKDETREPRAATDIEKPGLTAPRTR